MDFISSYIWSHKHSHGGPKGLCPLKFLAYLVALLFQSQNFGLETLLSGGQDQENSSIVFGLKVNFKLFNTNESDLKDLCTSS